MSPAKSAHSAMTPTVNTATTAVDVNALHTGHVVARAHQPLQRAVRKHQAERAAGRRKQQALHQPLAQQAQPAAAHRGSDRLFLSPRRRPRHQQIGNVHARDQQQAPGGRQQHIKRSLDLAHHVLQQRPDVRRRVDERQVDGARRRPAARSRSDRRLPCSAETPGFSRPTTRNMWSSTMAMIFAGLS